MRSATVVSVRVPKSEVERAEKDREKRKRCK
jgi:hypothetical protein